MTRSPSPSLSFIGRYTLVPLATSPSSPPHRRQLRHASSSVSIRSLLSHIGDLKRKARRKADSSLRSSSTTSLLSRKRSRHKTTASPYYEPDNPSEAWDVLESPATVYLEATPESLDPFIRGVHAEWHHSAQSLGPDQRNCLLGAVCLGIREPLQDHPREDIGHKMEVR